jgi:uncharacterized protein
LASQIKHHHIYSLSHYCDELFLQVKILTIVLSLYSISFLFYSGASFTVHAQSDLQTIKYRNLVIDLGNGVKTNAQLTYPAVEGGGGGENGTFPAVLLITGSGAEDMNETADYIRIDNNNNKTGSKIYIHQLHSSK